VPERSALFQGVQIGKETTIGTSVAAGKLLNYLSVDIDPEITVNRFRPMGQAVASAILPSQDSTTAAISGVGSYSEFVYPFSSLWGTVTPSTVDTTAKSWVWTPTARAEMTPVSYTVEAGGAVRAHKATGLIFSGMELTFNRTDGVTVGGSAYGQNLQDNITLTGSPAAIEEAPILPTHIDVYVDSTSAGIGVTKMTRDFNIVFRNNDQSGPIWPINSTLPSWAAPVGTEPTVQMEMTLEADTQGMGLLPDLRAGSTKYVRIACISTVSAGSTTTKYSLTIDMAGKISASPTFDETDGVYTVNWTLDSVYDAAWGSGQYLKVTAVNKVAAL
jgi:hypothetical protein